MNKKLKRVIAYIALTFMAIFIVTMMMYFIDSTLLNGAVGGIALASGLFALALWVVIYLDNKAEKVNEANKKMVDEENERYKKAKERREQAKALREASNNADDTIAEQPEHSEQQENKDE